MDYKNGHWCSQLCFFLICSKTIVNFEIAKITIPHPTPYFLFSDLATLVTCLKMTSDMTVSKMNKGYTDPEIHRFFYYEC